MECVSAGGFGDVWKCNYNADGPPGISALVAVKAFRFSERDSLETINRSINREIGILRILRHKNIVPLWGVAVGFGRIPELRCLVSRWIPNGTLNAYLASNHNDLTILDRSRMLEDVSAGLCYLHSKSVMHGDITGANILIDKGGHARLIDFGLSTIIQPLLGQSHLAISSVRPGAIRYAAPELVLSENAHELPVPLEKADIYSFGCIMLQVLSGRLPWSEIRGDALIIVTISQGSGPQRPDGRPAIIDLDWNFIQKCLQFKPELRPSAEEVLDFVIHRLSTPDSCSRPPDDPPDDAQDDFPGASPPDSSTDSDIAEQPSDSPPPHPDHELKSLTKVVDNLSASASTPSTPAHPESPPHYIHYRYNYLSGGSSGSSSTPEHSGHSLSEMFQCMWGDSNGLHCNDLIRGHNLSSHLREVHGIQGSDIRRVMCKWDHCNMELNKESLARHVEEKHMMIRHCCDQCGKAFSRMFFLSEHKKRCPSQK